KLLKLYDTKNLREKLLIAELHRNLGNFDESTEILESIRNKDYIWIRNILLYECQKKNKKTVRLEKGSIRQVKKGNKLVFEEPAQELFCENCGTSNFIFSNDKAPYKCSYCKYGLKR
ncbi:MAG: hypothetical protein LBU66_00815, partial [Treponema sp.]|nr:hypothetical protein [Treponema sp.]